MSIFGNDFLMEDEQCVAFNITDDNIMEPTESFTVTATGGEFFNGLDSTEVIIADNDGEQ